MTGALQASLSGGELSPGLWGRVDMARYATCLETAKNVVIQPYGGIKNRSGFEYLGEVKDSTDQVRLIPFIYSDSDSYVLEFGDYYVRMWRSGNVLRYPIGNVIAWSGATDYGSSGLVVSYNGVYYYILQYPNINHQPDISPTWWYPLTGLIIEMPTPYSVNDIFDISFAQSADTVFLAHKSYAPRTLKRYSAVGWIIAELAYQNGPFSILNSSSYTLQISAETGNITITCATGSSIFNSTQIGQLIYIESPNYGRPWQAGVGTAIGAVVRSDGKYYEAQTTATTGTVRPVHSHGDWSDGIVTWRYLHSGYGIARLTSIVSGGVICNATVVSRFPTELITVPSLYWSWCDWGGPYDWPGVVCIHQQRLCFGGSPGFPETIWLSKIGNYLDFGVSSPVLDDDSISVTLAANTVQEIRGLLSMNDLLVMASGGAWRIGTGDQDALTPANIGAKLQTFRGAAKLDPLGVGRSCLYLQEKGQIIRDLSYELNSSSYQAFDLTTMANHLFEGYSITDWAWQESPFQTIWAVRSDGTLLSCVYVREQEVLAWAQHETQGLVESVCVIPEGDEHVVYCSIIRPIDGAFYRFIERMATRNVQDIQEAFFVDCGLLFDNSYLGSAYVIIWNGTNWDETETLTCTASIAIFTGATDIGDQIVFVLDDGTKLRFTIESLFSTTIAYVRASKIVPVAMRGADLYGWNWARDTFSVPHLVGETVSILGDGHVYPQQEVSAGGTVTLDPPCTKAVIGLPYNADLKTLDPALNLPETPMDKKKNITQVRFLVRESRGFKAGRAFDSLYEARTRTVDLLYDSPPELETDIKEIAIACTWEPRGSICLRQDDPLPINWIALIPELAIGGK